MQSSHSLTSWWGQALRAGGGEVPLFSNEEKNWGSTAGGWSITPAEGLGVRWPGNELSLLCALQPSCRRCLRVLRPGMTCHSRTCCKRRSDEFTNKMPTVFKSKGHMSLAGHSSRAWLGAGFLPRRLLTEVSTPGEGAKAR